MKPESARPLSNSYQDVHLFSIHTWPEAASLREPGSRGPYIVMQTAIDPEDLRATVEDFILGKMGRWLPLYLFQRLPDQVQREQFIFPAAAQAIAVLQTLNGRPVIERGIERGIAAVNGPGSLAPDDSLNQAILEARQRGADSQPRTNAP